MLIHRCDCYLRTLSCSLLCLFSQVIPGQAMVRMHQLLSASMGGARILILGARRASAISTSPDRSPATAFSCRHFWSNGRNPKSGGELTILRFNSRKAVCLLKASSSAKKNVSNSQRHPAAFTAGSCCGHDDSAERVVYAIDGQVKLEQLSPAQRLLCCVDGFSP